MASAVTTAEQQEAKNRVEQDGNANPPQNPSPKTGAAPSIDAIRGQLGPNNEKLDELRPDLISTLKELMLEYRVEGLVARRHEIRRIRQARLFWQGLQYAFWNPQDMNWHLPWEAKIYDDSSLAEMPRYQFVTNLYQAFGLSFVSVISQDVPATRFYPQSTLSEVDIETAKAASQVADLIEQNNRVQQLLTSLGFFLWTDGKIGGYVRYVADGQRFGWRDELLLEERWVRMGRDAYVCPNCGAETEVGDEVGTEATPLPNEKRDSSDLQNGPRNDTLPQMRTSSTAATFLAGTICAQCGAALGPKD